MESKEEFEHNIDDFLRQWNADIPFIKARTSGSTGKPKTILLPKKAMFASAERTNAFFNVGKRSLLYNCVSVKYIGGKMMYVRSFLSGAEIISEPASNTPLYGVSPDMTITLLSVVPSQMIHILKLKEKNILPGIDNIIIGGSAINPNLREQIVDSGLNAYETYGMTETCSHIALRKIESDCNLPYKTLPGIRIYQDDRDCLVIESGESGRIVTNDVVEITSCNSFNIKGRYDNVIITGGKKVFPENVEKNLSKYVKSRFIATSRSHEKWGEELVIITDDISLAEQKYDLLRRLKGKFPPETIPKDIIYTSHLPYSENGKPIRLKL